MAKADFERYIGIPYTKGRGPQEIRGEDLDTIRQKGWNCQACCHRLYEDVSFPLPRSLLSQELYFDRKTFRTLRDREEWQELDIGLYGRRSLRDPKQLHVITCIGLDRNGNPIFIHATDSQKDENGKGTTCYTTTRELLLNPRHEVIFARKRHKGIEDFEAVIFLL